MFNRLLPQRFDNTYRGNKLALWLLALVVLLRVTMSLGSIFNGYSVVTSADGIPLDTFPSAAAQTILSLFALLGLSHLMICLLCALVLVRYRSMVPIMLALLLLHFLGGRLILYLLPIIRTGTPPGFYVNSALFALMILGLVLSLRRKGDSRAQES
jgi:predicted tellurium resistance membrane protein TerC